MLRRGSVFRAFFTVALVAALLFPPSDLKAGEELYSGFLDAVNNARMYRGLAPLLENQTLNMIAGLFATDMAKNNHLSHESFTYGSVFAYLKSTGFPYSCAGISIVCDQTMEAATAALIRTDSKILTARYSRVGIGAAPMGDGYVFVALYTGNMPGTATGVPAPTAEPDLTLHDRLKPAKTPVNEPSPAGLAYQLNSEESAMLAMVNRERVKAGLYVLSLDPALTRLARSKAQDMVDLNYFRHTSPTYGSAFDMMGAAGISFRTAGENLAKAPSAERAFSALMNSPGHRANILNPSFTSIGIGMIEGGPYRKIFVQLFTG